ncbi:MAG: flippase [Actinomycetota bacterium]
MTATDSNATTSQASALVGARLITAVLGWVGTIIVARSLGRDEFGEFVFVFALLGMLSVVTDLGVGRVALRGLLPDVDDRALFGAAYFGLRLVMGFAGHGLAMVYVLATDQPGRVVLATLIGGFIVDLATPSHAIQTLFQAERRLGYVGFLRILGQTAQLALTCAVVLSGGGLVLLVIPVVVHELIVLGGSLRLARRMMPVRFAVDLALWRELLREAVPLSIAQAFTTVTARVDTLLLSALVGSSAVASYGIAYKFIDLAHFVALAVGSAVLAELVRSVDASDQRRFAGALDDAGSLLAFAAGGFVVTTLAVSEPLVRFLYGDEFADAADPLRILTAAEGIAFLAGIGTAALVATGRYRAFVLAAAAGLVLNVGLNLVVIPDHGPVGAAATTLASEALVLALVLVACRDLTCVLPATGRALLRVVPGLVAGLAVGFVVAARLPWPLAGLFALLTYLAVCGRVPGAIPRLRTPQRNETER